MKIFIETERHNGEGQTVCQLCALKGLGTGAIFWDSWVFGVTVNYNYVGCFCRSCFIDYRNYLVKAGNDVSVDGYELSEEML